MEGQGEESRGRGVALLQALRAPHRKETTARAEGQEGIPPIELREEREKGMEAGGGIQVGPRGKEEEGGGGTWYDHMFIPVYGMGHGQASEGIFFFESKKKKCGKKTARFGNQWKVSRNLAVGANAERFAIPLKNKRQPEPKFENC